MSVAFGSVFRKAPHWIVRAPGRVNLIGEHTDYNGGFVLPMAIDRYTEVLAAPNDSNRIRVVSTAFDDGFEIEHSMPIAAGAKGEWANYPKGVIAGFREAGYPVQGLDVLIHSDVPLGAGLSSSASIEVGMATVLEAAAGVSLDPVVKAELCRDAEHRFAQVPCGIMDQFASTLSRENHLLLIDCQSLKPDWIEMRDPSISVLIVQTNVRHQLASSEYAIRRQQCEKAATILGVSLLRETTRERLEGFRDAMSEVVYRRARHILTESVRTWRAAQAIREHRWLEAGQLMYSSHESLRDDFEVSCAELDAVVEIAQNIGPRGGVYGCRMTGGGFGGCAVALIETDKRAAISRTVELEYREVTGLAPQLFVSRPAAGARIVYQDHSRSRKFA